MRHDNKQLNADPVPALIRQKTSYYLYSNNAMNFMQKKCDKCKIPVLGGFNPTGFCFNMGGYDKILCRSCYEYYWIEFNKIEKTFIENFFNHEFHAKEIEMMLK